MRYFKYFPLDTLVLTLNFKYLTLYISLVDKKLSVTHT